MSSQQASFEEILGVIQQDLGYNLAELHDKIVLAKAKAGQPLSAEEKLAYADSATAYIQASGLLEMIAKKNRAIKVAGNG
jgi:hypothetical protein